MPIIEVNPATTLEEVASQIEEALGYSVDHYTRVCDLVLGQWLMVCRSIDVDALLELASAMQDDAAICPHADCREHICSYARQIRKALGEEG